MKALILGLDPSLKSIPDVYKENQETDVLSWGKDIIEVCHEKIIGVKFQTIVYQVGYNLIIIGENYLIKRIF